MDKYIKTIIKEAEKAYKKNEVPVGAIIVKNNKIIAKSHNNRQHKYSVLGHAEINCIIKAEKKLKDWRLNECEMYVTLKPCKMCYEIIRESRLNKIYYILDKENNSYQIDKNIEIKQINTNISMYYKEKYKIKLDRFFNNMRLK